MAARPAGFLAVPAAGRSMWPAIRSGDVLLVDVRAQPAPGQVWLVQRGEARIAHRVVFVDAWKGEVVRVRCRSDRGAWDPWTLRADLVGRVVLVEREGALFSVESRLWHTVARWLAEGPLRPIGRIAAPLLEFCSLAGRTHHDAAATAPRHESGLPRD